jgi:hypothetical protein
MKVHFRSRDSGIVRWQQRGVERLRQALRHIRRLLAVDRQPEALALIPIRAVQPRAARESHRRTWRD